MAVKFKPTHVTDKGLKYMRLQDNPLEPKAGVYLNETGELYTLFDAQMERIDPLEGRKVGDVCYIKYKGYWKIAILARLERPSGTHLLVSEFFELIYPFSVAQDEVSFEVPT
jgi:hypothetical protein